jgi:hypothetical protein
VNIQQQQCLTSVRNNAACIFSSSICFFIVNGIVISACTSRSSFSFSFSFSFRSPNFLPPLAAETKALLASYETLLPLAATTFSGDTHPPTPIAVNIQ